MFFQRTTTFQHLNSLKPCNPDMHGGHIKMCIYRSVLISKSIEFKTDALFQANVVINN